jgi:DNA polymerase
MPPRSPLFTGVSAPKLDRAARIEALDALAREASVCTKCDLCRGRLNVVFGEGDCEAAIMFVGEGPGQTEDQTGRPFVGDAGQLLDKMILAMGLSREQVYITNTVKCRPPNNRAPLPEELEACWPYLRRQIEIIQPRVIVTLGGSATKLLLQTQRGITAIRGIWAECRPGGDAGPIIRLMPTFHPSYLLRSYTKENRARVWSDLQKVMEFVQGPSE